MTPAKASQNWLPGIFNDFFGNEWIAKSNSSAPAINILETDKEYEVEIAAPGITKDDFNVTVTKDNHLIVTVENKSENEEVKFTLSHKIIMYTSVGGSSIVFNNAFCA